MTELKICRMLGKTPRQLTTWLTIYASVSTVQLMLLLLIIIGLLFKRLFELIHAPTTKYCSSA